MEKPFIMVDGQKHEPPRPNMKVWRELVEYDSEDKQDRKITELMTGHLHMVSVIYGIDEDELADGMDIADIIPAYLAAARWVISLIYEKMKQLPNVEAQASN